MVGGRGDVGGGEISPPLVWQSLTNFFSRHFSLTYQSINVGDEHSLLPHLRSSREAVSCCSDEWPGSIRQSCIHGVRQTVQEAGMHKHNDETVFLAPGVNSSTE
jgi:hypothetical protein